MAVRYPPKKPANSAARARAGKERILKYEPPPENFRQRAWRFVSNPILISGAFLFLAVITVGLVYYYRIFSERIDRLLRGGEIFTRSAGIYAAPKTLHVGESTSVDDVVNWLRQANYVAQDQQADSSRGRFALKNGTLEIAPSADSTIDNQKPFPHLRVTFTKNGRQIAALTDIDSGKAVNNAALEPEIISSFTGRERAKRRIVGFKDLPPVLVKAVTVTEDRSFFDHWGINFRGILRALVRRYDSDPKSPIARQGGSSITQQLVKNLLLSPEYSLRRKLAEAYMSLILETRLSKQEIFALYANQIYLGQRAGFAIHGFGEAAEDYFGKDVTQLTLPEAAFLAGIIRSPNRYNPYHNLDTATARRNQVLDSMAEAGVITQGEAEDAKRTPLKVAPTRGRLDSEAPYFVDYVQNQLGDLMQDTSNADHLRIYTSLDLNLQRAAQNAVNKQLAALDKIFERRRIPPGTLQAALVAMNTQTGEIIAMVGGRDYEKSQLNRATDALRQPGSVFKPFVYATALNTAFDPVPRVITPATMYMDAPKTFTYDNQEYSPGNFGDTYTNQPMTLRDALVNSKNVITVEVAQEVTIGRVMALAAKAGLPKPKRAYPAMALGTNEATPLQIASAYTAFAANGIRSTPVPITRVTTGRGATIIAPQTQHNEVLRPEVAFVMTSFMKDVVARGTAARLKARGFRFNVAGKTGTSRDGWFAGYTPHIVCVIYVGFDDGSQLGLTGADSALPIFADFMTAALTAHPEWQGDWKKPEGVQEVEIDVATGKPVTAEEKANALQASSANDAANDANGSAQIQPAKFTPRKTRIEYFINNTAPSANAAPSNSDENSVDENQIDEMRSEQAAPNNQPYAPPMKNAPLPPPPPLNVPPRLKNPAHLDGHGAADSDGATHLMGTVTLDIDPTTGLIADPSVCPVIRTKTFPLGQEPRRYCGAEYHNGKTLGATRPRTISP
jgi:penicillin-binding protein 1B